MAHPDIAPKDQIWVCSACGKTSRNRQPGTTNNGWDESCRAHAVLCFEQKKDGVWVAVDFDSLKEETKCLN